MPSIRPLPRLHTPFIRPLSRLAPVRLPQLARLPRLPRLPLLPRPDLATLPRPLSPPSVRRVPAFATHAVGVRAARGTHGPAAATVRPAAATDVVTTTADSGPGSLRDVVASAGSGDTITFNINPPGPIVLTSGPIIIGVSLTINTSTAAPQTVSGNNNSRIFTITGNVQVTLNNLIIRDGNASSGGAAVS